MTRKNIEKTRPPVIAVDFDLTISPQNFEDFSMEVEPTRGVEEFLQLVKTYGCRVVLWTCREGDSLQEAKDYLESWGLLKYFSGFNENLELNGYPDCRKIFADLYVDDRAYQCAFGGVDFKLAFKACMRLDYVRNNYVITDTLLEALWRVFTDLE